MSRGRGGTAGRLWRLVQLKVAMVIKAGRKMVIAPLMPIPASSKHDKVACTANLVKQLVPNLYFQTVVKQSAKKLTVVFQRSKRVVLQGVKSLTDVVLPCSLFRISPNLRPRNESCRRHARSCRQIT